MNEDETRPLVRTHPWLVGAGLRGGLTTRVGFPSAGVGDDDEPSRQRLRATLARALGVEPERMAWVRQVHGARVAHVDGSAGLHGEGDALVSSEPGKVLLVSVADCGPVLLWDTRGPAFAVAHAGWRGVVGGVIEATVDALEAEGSDPAHLRAWIGPCIGPARFEVGEEVAAQFRPEEVRAPSGSGRPHVDLPAAIRLRLERAGLAPDSIRASGDCTYERDELYWSFRRDRGICGRHLGYLTRG